MHLQFTKWILSDCCFWTKKSNFPCLCPCTQSAQPGINIFETKIQSKGFIWWLLRNFWYLFNHAFNGKWFIFKKCFTTEQFILCHQQLSHSEFSIMHCCCVTSLPVHRQAVFEMMNSFVCISPITNHYRWKLTAFIQCVCWMNYVEWCWIWKSENENLFYYSVTDAQQIYVVITVSFFYLNCFHVTLIRWHASWHKEGRQRCMRHSFLVLLVLENVYAQTGWISSNPTKLG